MNNYIENLINNQSYFTTNILIGIGIFIISIIVGALNNETLGFGHSDNTESYLVRYLITLPLTLISTFLLGCSALVIILKNI